MRNDRTATAVDGTAAQRKSIAYRRTSLVAAVLSFVGIIPHVIEDFLAGVPETFALSTPTAAWLLGIALTVQIGLLPMATSDSKAPLVGIVVYGLGWVAAALVDHPAIMPGAFRSGIHSRLWILLIVAGQATAAVTAALALGRARRAE